MGSERRRADTLLAERGLAASRSAAAASVRAGRVRLGGDGPSVSKPGQMVPSDADLVVEAGPEFVSRGGVKLANALADFEERGDAVPVAGRDCLDVGASTGGFTDCLLARGAARVIALDVGYGQLAWNLRQDDRVTVMERVNARALAEAELPYAPALVSVDVSFISLALVLGPIAAVAADDADLLAMVKPQFELGPERVGRGGVVREASDRRDAIRAVAAAGEREGLILRGLASSGLPGPKGNRETFIRFARGGEAADLDRELERVEPAVMT
ncbi:MAG: TlyA family RNA methyltransferase [Solirubrobacterales bacterium]|nr:TlyA family RNA methyltransferase [Solirubrobacterales bacterium]